ncbi:endo alpha-1,4 polygalactosaminidase [Streptomyces sp. NPDC047002]|uniref:endo alpha-1,4 polygalactosaminidase n=1 Tax=Streptomyces sp. NPDC047002 TaxID=3155475 RepID=UPI003452AFAC
MTDTTRPRPRRGLAALAAVTAAVAISLPACSTAGAAAPAAALPPVHAGFDYQINKPYQPPAGVRVVSRDHTASPAQGLYNICYVNAFQAQPGAEAQWPGLLLKDANGQVVYDEDWGEAMLDTRTDEKRKAIAAKVDAWIDSCAAKGFDAVEPDNLDTFDRTDLLSEADAKATVKLLADHAHEKGLAVAQKNTAQLSTERADTGLDFAIAEECGEWDECGDYVEGFGDHVIVIEYEQKYFTKTCSGYGDRLSVVLRDRDVLSPGDAGYVRKVC